MSTTSSLFTASDGDPTLSRADVGYLPKNAITEWLLADALAQVELEEDTCGNLVGKGSGMEVFNPDKPVVVRTRLIRSSHKNVMTNQQWCQEEVRQHNIRYPNKPWVVRYSAKRPDFICICKA